MSAAPSPVEGTDRLLMFLFEDVRYAMPIAWVVEVAEKDRVTSVPSLALPVGGVMNIIRHTGAFAAQEQDVVDPEVEFGMGNCCVGR